MSATGVQTPQNMAALARGNEVRVKNAQTKLQIAGLPQPDGFELASRVLRDPTREQEAMQLFGLIASVRQVGEQAAARALRRAGILNPGKRVRDLTPRQRDLVADWLDFEAELRLVEREERRAQ